MTDPPAPQCVLVGVFSYVLHSEDRNLQSPHLDILFGPLTSKGGGARLGFKVQVKRSVRDLVVRVGVRGGVEVLTRIAV